MKRISFKDSGGLNLTQAVLSGRKTMTRRKVNRPVLYSSYTEVVSVRKSLNDSNWYVVLENGRDKVAIQSPYSVGELVAIQQAYRAVDAHRNRGNALREQLMHTAGWDNKMFVKAKFMPHHIRITDVRVERLQDISSDDCIREGVQPVYPFNGEKYVYISLREAFAALIDKVSGRGTWGSNPLVWCYSFELVD